jgi:hypothetical protein
VNDIITELYTEHVDTLIEHIEATGILMNLIRVRPSSIVTTHIFTLPGIAAPTIIGIDWRLDYSVKSKNAGRENATMFYISLKVKDRGVMREINMIASIEELQDLLSKVGGAEPAEFSFASRVPR